MHAQGALTPRWWACRRRKAAQEQVQHLKNLRIQHNCVLQSPNLETLTLVRTSVADTFLQTVWKLEKNFIHS